MQTVYVGLSGGVDSAVSAALLQRQGYNVTGVFIKIWQPEFIECTWERDRIDAMRVAAALNIPFREIDLSDAYKREVVEEMTQGYKKGVTPNPDVFCNERIKFGAFAAWAFSEGVPYVATGHYARIEEQDGAYRLMRGIDPAKDQSYFLYRIPRENLSRVLFPVGVHTKTEVRRLAQQYHLPVAAKRDSQGLCFVGDVNLRDFLRRYISIDDGNVLDRSGRIIGRHEGAALYTIGQRHGFEIAGSAAPHFVTSIDVRANTISVSSDRHACERSDASLRDMHWLSDVALPVRALVQARYREFPVHATVDGTSVAFDSPHIVSPGQDLVLYDADMCLGGGRIV